jgi:hypothetical protein
MMMMIKPFVPARLLLLNKNEKSSLVYFIHAMDYAGTIEEIYAVNYYITIIYYICVIILIPYVTVWWMKVKKISGCIKILITNSNHNVHWKLRGSHENLNHHKDDVHHLLLIAVSFKCFYLKQIAAHMECVCI